MKIVKVNENEIEKLYEVYETHTETIEEEDQYKELIIRNIPKLINGSRETFALVEGDEYIAECSLGLKYDEPDFTIENRRACLSFMIVRKDHINKGLGRRMLEYVFSYLKEKDYSEISLEVNLDNQSALHLYEKCGFNKVIREIIDGNEKSVVLLKDLSV